MPESVSQQLVGDWNDAQLQGYLRGMHSARRLRDAKLRLPQLALIGVGIALGLPGGRWLPPVLWASFGVALLLALAYLKYSIMRRELEMTVTTRAEKNIVDLGADGPESGARRSRRHAA
jgi:hypothetical protein